MSDGNDRTINNADSLIATIEEGRVLPTLTQREKDLIAADERLLMMLTDKNKTPDEIREYLDVETTMPRLVDLSETEVIPTVKVVPTADEMDEEEDEPQAMPEKEEEEGVPGDGCKPGFKRPRGNPTGPCEEARKTQVPKNLEDYVGVPKPKKTKLKP
jgi:hypothetical protein